MHPALYSWREQLPATIVRLLAYLGGLALLSIAPRKSFNRARAMRAIKPADPGNGARSRAPFPAFALSIPEAADAPAHYAVRYNRYGAGRKDILSLGEPDGAGALSAGRDLPAGQRDRALRRAGGDDRPRRRKPRARSSRDAASRSPASSGRCRSSPSTPPRHAALPRFPAQLRRSAAAIVRLVLPGRRPGRALDLVLRARPAHAFVGRQRAQVGALFAKADLKRSLLRRARSHPRRHAEIQGALAGARHPPAAAPHRTLSGVARVPARPL